MRVDVTMPNLGYDMEEGKIQAWLKQVGDRIERGEAIAEIETDKTTVEMEAMTSGTLVEIVCESGIRGGRGCGHRGHRGRLRVNGKVVEQTRMRAAIARRMTESKQQAPHFYVQTTVARRRRQRERIAALNAADPEAPRLTMTVALLRACIAALRAHPRLNSVWTPEGLLEVDEINVGVAIALDEGLIAPALIGAAELDARATAAALRDLAARARDGKLRPPELSEATFTLSNLGMFDVSAFTAIVTPPQVAILATARPDERWLVSDEGPKRASVMTVTLSADHRALDGVDAARFLETFKQALENPETLLPEPPDRKEAAP